MPHRSNNSKLAAIDIKVTTISVIQIIRSGNTIPVLKQYLVFSFMQWKNRFPCFLVKHVAPFFDRFRGLQFCSTAVIFSESL